MTQWTSVRLAKARANMAKASTTRAMAKKGKQGQDKNKDSIECGNCGKRGHYTKDCRSKKDTDKGGSKGKHKSKKATDAHNIDSTKPANVEPEVQTGEFEMGVLDVDALQQQESEWIKIGVDTGKTAWLQSVTYGKKLLGHVDLTFRTETGKLVKSGERMYTEGCDDRGVNLRVRGVRTPVCKPLLSVGVHTTMGGVTVLCQTIVPRGLAGRVRTCKTGESRSRRSRRSTRSNAR